MRESTISMLDAEIEKYQKRIEKVYEDYLDEKIPEELYKRKFDEFRAAQKKVQNKRINIEQVEDDYYGTASHLLKLSLEAPRLFEKANHEQKRALINLVLSNLQLKGNQLLDNLQLIEPVVDQVLDTLKKDHDNMQAFYINSIKQTRNDYTKLEKRLSLLYEDRLDGRITVDEYDTIVSKTKEEMEKLDQRMVQLTNNDKSFIVTSSYLLKLASRAGKLFKSLKPELKSKILYLVLSNLELDDKKLYFNPLPPFDRLLAFSESSTWLAIADTLRTASIDFDNEKLRIIKEILV